MGQDWTQTASREDLMNSSEQLVTELRASAHRDVDDLTQPGMKGLDEPI